jgi:hypothetical protein
MADVAAEPKVTPDAHRLGAVIVPLACVAVAVSTATRFFGSETYIRSYEVPRNRHTQTALLVIVAIGIVAVVGCLLRAAKVIESKAIGFVFMGITILAGVGVPVGIQQYVPEVDYTTSGVVPNKHTIIVGMSVTFATPANGVLQVICIGEHGACPPSPASSAGPPELREALAVAPGQRKTILFDRLGTFPITSRTPTNANMDMLIVVVRPPANDDADGD